MNQSATRVQSETDSVTPIAARWPSRWTTGAILTGIVAFHLLGTLYWIQHNVVLIGHDATGYLETSLEYFRFLTELTPQTIYRAFTFPPYRTPGLYLAVQPFLHGFGANMDGAQLLNAVLLAGVILLTFYLARVVAGRSAALFAAFFVGLLPLVSAMARLYYTELFLTVMVVLNLLALYRSRGFASRSWSLLWGASLGIGLLVKWTMPIYVALPTLWVFWSGGLFQNHLTVLRSFRIDWRSSGLAVLIGLALAALWYLPNRAELQATPLGGWTYWAWALMLTVLAYALLRPSSPVTNWWAGLLLGASLASLWYLPHADFASQLLAVDEERSQEAIGVLASGNYLRYLRYIYAAHLGPLFFWSFAPAALAPWLWALFKQRDWFRPVALLWLSLLSSYALLSLLSQSNERNLVPLLPIMTILAIVGLWHYPRSARWAIGGIWLTVLVIQWSIYTFDDGTPIRQSTAPLWAASAYSVPPASGVTDVGYWIGPDVLNAVGAGRETTQSLAMLVNTEQIHRGVLRYLAATMTADVKINDATEADARGWFEVLGSQWVLLKDGDNRELEGPGLTVVERILADDPLFHSLYTEAARYSLPNGETVYLYHREVGPGHPEADPTALAEASAVAEAIRANWSDRAVLVFGDRNAAVWVGMQDIPADHFLVAEQTGPATEALFDDLRGTIMVALNPATADLEDWLDANAYRALGAGGDRLWLEIYGRGAQALAPMIVTGEWPEVSVAAARSDAEIRPGEVLPIETTFAGTPGPEWKLSYRLVDPAGQVVATQDRQLRQSDRFGLIVPPLAEPGAYAVAAVLYDGATLAPIADVDGNEQVTLFAVNVVE